MSFVAYTQYICVCFSNLNKLNGLFQFLIVEKVMKHLQRTNIPHAFNM